MTEPVRTSRGPGTADRGPGAPDPDTLVSVTKAELDELIQQVFAIGMSLRHSDGDGPSRRADVDETLSSLDGVVRAIQSMALCAQRPAATLDDLADVLTRAAAEVSRIAANRRCEADAALVEAVYCLHRARFAAAEARTALTRTEPLDVLLSGTRGHTAEVGE